MELEKRKENFQKFIFNNLEQLFKITDKEEQAKFIVGAVEYYFINIEPNLDKVEEGEFTEQEVREVTPDLSNEFREINLN